MPAKDRPPSFQFYPREWIVDTRHLTRDQRCRYHDALCESWLSESYGVAPEDQWRQWMGYPPSKWADVRDRFATFFASENGVWIQRKMREVRNVQQARFEQAAGAGRASAEKKRAFSQRPFNDRSTTVASEVNGEATLAFASAFDSPIKEKPLTLPVPPPGPMSDEEWFRTNRLTAKPSHSENGHGPAPIAESRLAPFALDIPEGE